MKMIKIIAAIRIRILNPKLADSLICSLVTEEISFDCSSSMFASFSKFFLSIEQEM